MINHDNIKPLSAFNDNYIWLFLDPQAKFACVVDPGDAAVVEQALIKHGVQLTSILVTHHHFDHTAGISELVKKHPAVNVYGCPSHSPDITHPVKEGSLIKINSTQFRVIETPGHTLDHIVYFEEGESTHPILFSGDTLFAGGCGRLFEGSPRQMYSSLQRLSQLPPSTKIYCAHEYTHSNLEFATVVEPSNMVVYNRLLNVRIERENLRETVPSLMSEELLTNPFLRTSIPEVIVSAQSRCGKEISANWEVFKSIRQWKNEFKANDQK